MGKKGSEEKIIEEIQYLKEVFESFGGTQIIDLYIIPFFQSKLS